ncbi:hypothetical protein [Rickettsia sp. Tenjiku01]|uniref:hypothetical protein n=1 Tax=Rickettsia sp. Tenjiku01 TaxID=1736693 RepID=UPI000A9DE75E|nr:hypothetical protein [Rickettsia sp. Tenjiku01]
MSASSLIKWVCYLGDIAASDFFNSIATALIAVLHDAGDNMFNSKEEKKLVDVLTKFCKMINKQSDITPVGQDLQRLALLFANLRSVEIKKIMRQISVISLRLNCQCTINFFVMIPNNIKEMNSNSMEKLAFQDTIYLISYMYHHAEDILKEF